MANVNITYKGNTIAEMSESGTKTLLTGGNYCEDDIEVKYAPRSRTYEITLPKSAGWTLLTELDEDVLAHINDAHLVVTLINFSEYEYDQNAKRAMYATNMPLGIVNGTYNVYGNATLQPNETGVSHQHLYYPPNKTDNGTSYGGAGAFMCSDGKYYVTGFTSGLQAGSWRLTFTW